MHYKTNRQNHDFQIAYFIAGSCQTPDAAYAILCDLREDRSNAIKSFNAHSLRDQAKMIKAQRKLQDDDEAVRLEGQADIEEMKAMVETTQKNYDAAIAELAFIDKCMERLQPLRQYAHLPDAEAHEAAQHEEWKLQLIHTAENHILNSGMIPPDHFATMRMHPSFATEILPALEKTKMLLNSSGKSQEDGALLVSHLQTKQFDLPKLLELK
jgi:hypothetical protein